MKTVYLDKDTGRSDPAVAWANWILHDRGWAGEHEVTDERVEPPLFCDDSLTWHYPDSFGGVQLTPNTSVPSGLTIQFRERNLVIRSHGSVFGCEQHQPTQYVAQARMERANVVAIDNLLDGLEAKAKAADPREYMECLFFGDCGHQVWL